MEIMENSLFVMIVASILIFYDYFRIFDYLKIFNNYIDFIGHYFVEWGEEHRSQKKK